MKKFILLALVASLSLPVSSFADEGMWLPLLIKRLNHKDMKKEGLKLTADEIYNVNKSSLKDAIVSLGGFCTSEVISPNGLMLTNHHCAYDAVQSHSSPENDYLTNGFWAGSYDEELPNPGLTAAFLVRMEDVTEKVMKELEGKEGQERAQAESAIMGSLAEEAVKDTHYNARVKSFFEGNEYYMFVYETYKDVRLVGAPPEGIGKFGGDTDNWMWPRHTGDFALLRVYAGPDGKPAEYSKDNKPLKSKHFLPINVGGVENGDYAMVMGYPGRTQRYRTSFGLEQDFTISNPARIKLRDKRLELMKEDMDASKKVRIMYASKYAQVSNYYKYFIGQNRGLKRLGTIDKKKAEEAKYQKWADANGSDEMKKALSELEAGFKDQNDVQLPFVYFSEAVLGSELASHALAMNELTQLMAQGAEESQIKAAAQSLKSKLPEMFKDYNIFTDKKIFTALMRMYYKDLTDDFQPKTFKEDLYNDYNEDFSLFSDAVFSNTMLVFESKMAKFLDNPTKEALQNDMGLKLFSELLQVYMMKVQMTKYLSSMKIDAAMQAYVKGLRKMQSNKVFYPDANSTMRLTYGTVKAYEPEDGAKYMYFTTTDGILEKYDPNDAEFSVPEKLIDLIKKKDFGSYAGKNGEMPVCFITDNDITGGNSGSPVIDGEGQLIGLAFDGNWESMTGDLVYDKEFKRCINVDIRYVLFVIDKFAGAGNIIKELKLVK